MNTLALKQEVLVGYAVEKRDWLPSRSYAGVTHLAKSRGATVGHAAAEGFMLGHFWQ